MADQRHAQVLEVVGHQRRQHLGIDVILAECRRVLLQAQTLQPSPTSTAVSSGLVMLGGEYRVAEPLLSRQRSTIIVLEFSVQDRRVKRTEPPALDALLRHVSKGTDRAYRCGRAAARQRKGQNSSGPFAVLAAAFSHRFDMRTDAHCIRSSWLLPPWRPWTSMDSPVAGFRAQGRVICLGWCPQRTALRSPGSSATLSSRVFGVGPARCTGYSGAVSPRRRVAWSRAVAAK